MKYSKVDEASSDVVDGEGSDIDIDVQWDNYLSFK